MTKAVILSPHRDDAVFSLAMTLFHWRSLSVQVTVENFFTISDYGPHAIATDGKNTSLTPAISGQREREDHQTIAKINRRIRIRSAGLLDAPLRLEIDNRAICNWSDTSDHEAGVNLITGILKKLDRASATVAPLGLGNHIDHLTVRAAAIRTVQSRLLAFYEDLPYASWTSENAILERVRDTEDRLSASLCPATIRSSCSVYRKRRLAEQYRTQIQPAEASAIANFAIRYRGRERIWIPKHSPMWSFLA
jgi:LmbE family N-acetylglucosaminyl deacetylase